MFDKNNELTLNCHKLVAIQFLEQDLTQVAQTFQH